ncbi:hypothetical protein VP01_1428g2 [Puccinia sorghi]|uniref:CCHC-type domain-containing protein n=1 Tax=Puccinia sorghi TaxID=27349 RepID=A0A0L6VKI9_9BASI|nr:hypothetical protein VP01_1428g2 [Puccinia sorghi]
MTGGVKGNHQLTAHQEDDLSYIERVAATCQQSSKMQHSCSNSWFASRVIPKGIIHQLYLPKVVIHHQHPSTNTHDPLPPTVPPARSLSLAREILMDVQVEHGSGAQNDGIDGDFGISPAGSSAVGGVTPGGAGDTGGGDELGGSSKGALPFCPAVRGQGRASSGSETFPSGDVGQGGSAICAYCGEKGHYCSQCAEITPTSMLSGCRSGRGTSISRYCGIRLRLLRCGVGGKSGRASSGQTGGHLGKRKIEGLGDRGAQCAGPW